MASLSHWTDNENAGICSITIASALMPHAKSTTRYLPSASASSIGGASLTFNGTYLDSAANPAWTEPTTGAISTPPDARDPGSRSADKTSSPQYTSASIGGAGNGARLSQSASFIDSPLRYTNRKS